MLKCLVSGHNMIFIRDVIEGGGINGGMVLSLFKCTVCSKEEKRKYDR